MSQGIWGFLRDADIGGPKNPRWFLDVHWGMVCNILDSQGLGDLSNIRYKCCYIFLFPHVIWLGAIHCIFLDFEL